MLVSVWYWVTQQFFCAPARSDVDESVELLFDPESECCFCPRGRLLFTEPAVSAQDHTAIEPGTLGPQIISYKGPVRLCETPPHLSSQDCFSPIMCCLLTDRCINYEHLVQQICENMWKGNRRPKVSLNDDPVNVFACVCVWERRRCYRFCHLLRIFILIVVDSNRFSVTFVILSDFYFYSYQGQQMCAENNFCQQLIISCCLSQAQTHSVHITDTEEWNKDMKVYLFFKT